VLRDPVVHVGDAALALEDADALHLDLLGSEAFEQTAALAEEHRDDMELELVEDAGGECELRDCRAMDQHVAVARSLLGSSHRSSNVVQVGDQRPLPQLGGVVAGEDEDRYAVVVIAAPAAGRLEGSPAGDDCAGGHELVVQLAVHTRRAAGNPGVSGIGARPQPLVQAFPAVTEAIVQALIGPGDEPSRDMDM
jgi:hypothetical protein